MKAQTNFFDEIIVDNFAGGGGASVGMELALSRPVDIAINHDPDAVAMHRANHPYTTHYCESVWDIDPVKACAGRPVGLAWFSPDCKHFSKAKGGKPVDKNIRGLSWIILRWMLDVRPRVIMMENVEEITTWGPLIYGTDGKPYPDMDKRGETFKGFIAMMSTGISLNHPAFIEACSFLKISTHSRDAGRLIKGLGYAVEYKTLKACDYGTPTIRKRLFIVARCDKRPIVWPEPTHGNPKSEDVKSGKLLPWRTAAEVIDWSLLCPSIFDTAEEIYEKYGLRAQRPLAEATMRRIARGIQKFVIDNPAPFIIQCHSRFEKDEYNQISNPFKTTLTRTELAIVTPVIASIGQNGFSSDRSRSVLDPLNTTVSKAEQCLLSPVLAPYTVTNTTNSTGHPASEPIDTVRTGGGGGQMLVAPTLIQYHGEQSHDEVRGQSLEDPIMTVDSSPRYAMVSAFLSQYYDGGYKGCGNSAENPLNTITGIDHNAIVTTNLCILRNNCIGQEIDKPLHTIATSPGHFAEVRAFLVKYYGEGTGQDLQEPLHTATAQDRFGLVTISGIDYAIVDIGLRMLMPRELFAANGAPPDYIIDRDDTGKPYPKSKQVACCGNMVPPQFSEALVRANLPEMCGGKITTMAELERQVAI